VRVQKQKNVVTSASLSKANRRVRNSLKLTKPVYELLDLISERKNQKQKKKKNFMSTFRIVVVPLNRLLLIVRHVDISTSSSSTTSSTSSSITISSLKSHIISILSSRFLSSDADCAALCASVLRSDAILLSRSSSPSVSLDDSTLLSSLASNDSLLLTFNAAVVDSTAFVARFSSPDHVPPLETIPSAERDRRPPFEPVPPRPAAAAASRSGTVAAPLKSTNASNGSGSYSVDANCAYCFAQTSVGVFQESVTCAHCSKRNIAVSTIVASAECQCGAQTVRRAGGDALKCAKCSYSTREAKCTRCGTRFVYPSVWPSSTLPCANNCGAKLSVAEATVLPERVASRTLLRELTPTRSSALCGGSDIKVAHDAAWLCVQAYCDADARRMAEMDECLSRNLDSASVRGVFLLAESASDAQRFRSSYVAAVASGRLSVTEHGARLLMSEAFGHLNDDARVAAGDLCVLANADVFFDDSLGSLRDNALNNSVLALSRHDVVDESGLRIQFDQFVAPMAQDAWIFRKDRVPCLRRLSLASEREAREQMALLRRVERGEVAARVLVDQKVPNRATLSMSGIGRHCFGLPGSDNRLAADLRARSVEVLNTPWSVYVFHMHASGIRRYSKGKADNKTVAPARVDWTVEPPFAPVQPRE
jgi:hypothetical protein